jgi:DNA-binding transcriptional ArsR family regulator
MSTTVSDDRNALVKALAHPLRAQVYTQLREDEASPVDISQRIGAPLPNVAYHVRVLVEAGLVEQTRVKPVRGAVQHFYTATDVDVSCEALNVRLHPDDAIELAHRIRELVAEYDEDSSGDIVTVTVQPGPSH